MSLGKWVRRVGVCVCVGALAVVLASVAGRPAGAHGLNWGCPVESEGAAPGSPESPPGSGEGVTDVAVLDDVNVRVTGTVTPPPGGGAPLPVDETFDLSKMNAWDVAAVYPFEPAYWNLYKVDVNNDGVPDVVFAVRLRVPGALLKDTPELKTLIPDGISWGPTQEALSENFGVPLDKGAKNKWADVPGVEFKWDYVLYELTGGVLGKKWPLKVDSHFGTGFDVIVRRGKNDKAFDFDSASLKFEVGLEFTHEKPDKTTYKTETMVDVGFSSESSALPSPSGRFPDRAMVTAFYKNSPDMAPQKDLWDHGWFTLGFKTWYPKALDTPAKRPRLRHSVDIYELDEANKVTSTLLDSSLSWLHAPSKEGFALGLNEVCDPEPEPGEESRGQLSWNRDPAMGGTNILGLELKLEDGAGIAGKPIIDLSTVVSGLPERLDWVMRPNKMQFLRSADTVPSVYLTKLVIASKDPLITNDAEQAPLIMNGKILGLPERSVITINDNPESPVNTYGVAFCPLADPGVDTNPSPSVTKKPFTLCTPGSPVAPKQLTLNIQDYFDTETVEAAGFPEPPAGGDSYVLYAKNTNDITDCLPEDCVVPTRPVFRFAANLKSPRFATVTATPQNPNTTDAGVKIFSAALVAQKTNAVIHLDGRTNHEDEVANEGTLFDANLTIDKLPKIFSASYSSSEAQPLGLEVTTPANPPISKITGHGSAQLPGPDAIKVNGQLALGKTGSSLPPTFSLAVTRSTDNKDLTEHEVRFTTPPKSKFLPVTVRAGAVISTKDERDHGIRTRAWTDSKVGALLKASWTQDTVAGQLVSADFSACPDTGKCSNEFNAVVVHGPTPIDTGEDAANPNLLVAPPLPNVDDFVGTDSLDPHPPFTDFAGGEGIRAIILHDEWGLRGQLRNVRSVTYKTEATPDNPGADTLCAKTKPTGKPFVVNVFDYFADGEPYRPQLYVDAIVTKLPATLGARVDGTATADEPLLWTTTDDCASMTWEPGLHAVIGGQKQSEAGPRLDAIVRYGDNPGLINLGKTDGPVPMFGDPSEVSDPGPRPGKKNGITARLHYNNDGTHISPMLGGHVRTVTSVPKTLIVFTPTQERCDETTPEPVNDCHDGTLPEYETNTWQQYTFSYMSSLDTFGFFDGAARLHTWTPDGKAKESYSRYTVKVTDLPGSWRGKLRLDQNMRIARTEVLAQLGGNKAVPKIAVQVFDLLTPARFGQFSESVFNEMVPDYSLILRNVPDKFELSGEIYTDGERDAFEAALPPPPPPLGDSPLLNFSTCDDMVGYTPPKTTQSLGYVHADLDLDGYKPVTGWDKATGQYKTEKNRRPVAKLDLRANTLNGKAGVDIRGWGTHGEAAPFAGKVATRINNIVVDEAVHTPTPLADADFYACLDLDLPLAIEWSKLSRLDLGMNGLRTSATWTKQQIPDGAPPLATGPAISIGERNYAEVPNVNPEINVGAFYRRHYNCYDPPTAFDCDEFFVNTANQREDIKIIDGDYCVGNPGGEFPDMCYAMGATLNYFDHLVKPSFWTLMASEHDMLFDLFWDHDHRIEMVKSDMANLIASVGKAFYKGLFEKFTWQKMQQPGKVAKASMLDGSATIDMAQKCPWGQSDFEVPFTSANGPATGKDGTTYAIRGHCATYVTPPDPFYEDGTTGYEAWLVAYFPANANGVSIERWRVRLRIGDYPLTYPGGSGVIGTPQKAHYKLLPDARGGVEIESWVEGYKDKTLVGFPAGSPSPWDEPVPVASDHAFEYLDPSGIAGRVEENPYTQNLTLYSGDDDIVEISNSRTVTIDVCWDSQWVLGCGAPTLPTTYNIWVWGDGTQTVTGPGVTQLTHTYPIWGKYRVQVIRVGLGTDTLNHRAFFTVVT